MLSLPPPSRPGSRPDGPASPCSPVLRPNFMTKCYPIAADLQTMGRAVHLSNCSCMPLSAMRLSTLILRYAHGANLFDMHRLCHIEIRSGQSVAPPHH